MPCPFLWGIDCSIVYVGADCVRPFNIDTVFLWANTVRPYN